MTFLRQKLSKLIEQCDFFAAPILLRYRTEGDSKSKTGGCLSLILLILIAALFYNSWIAVFNKSEIKCEYQITRQLDPSPINVNSKNFILFVGFIGINIHDTTNKYFDVQVVYHQRVKGMPNVDRIVQMVPCQKRHLSEFEESIQNIYQMQNLQNFLCLPDDFDVMIGGKWASSFFSLIGISVKNCTTNCLPPQNLEAQLINRHGVNINYFFINKLLNPTMKDPISYYFEDKFYNIINSKIGIDNNIYISQYQIQTDQSLLPNQQIVNKKGFFIDRGQKQQFIYPIEYGTYAQTYFRKSDQKIKVKRIYRKIDDLLSYLGGLFGLIVAVFYSFISTYNKYCYQLEISKRIFKNESEKEQEQDINELREAVHCTKGTVVPPKELKSEQLDINFNFYTYIKLLISKVVFLFCSPKNWKEMDSLNQRLEQTENQMNIDLLLQKISFYERAFQCLFDKNQLTLLLLQEKISIKQLQEQRVIMNIEDQASIRKKQPIYDNKVANNYDIAAKESELGISKSGCQQDEQTPILESIFEAIDDLKRSSRTGNEISLKILDGIREDILKKYQKLKSKGKSKTRPKKLSQFSTFDKSHRTVRMLNAHQLDQKQTKIRYSNLYLESLQSEKISCHSINPINK